MKRVLVYGALALWAARAAGAQAADPPPAFEVASVKASPPPEGRGVFVRSDGGPGTKDPGRWTAQNFSLSNLVTYAYNLKRYEYSGPSWMDTERFDIVAKVPEGATKDQFRLMLQNLLAERFKLKIHREKKDSQVYDLVVAKNGPKLTESVNDPQGEGAGPGPGAGRGAGFGPGPPKIDKDGFPELPPGRESMTIMMNGRARTRQHNYTMESLANMLAGQIAKPVTEATGLKGKYDFTLTWATGGGGRAIPPPGGGAAGGGPESPIASMADDSGPTIFTAIQEQLGLKLEQKKGTIELVVVDHAEKTPTEN